MLNHDWLDIEVLHLLSELSPQRVDESNGAVPTGRMSSCICGCDPFACPHAPSGSQANRTCSPALLKAVVSAESIRSGARFQNPCSQGLRRSWQLLLPTLTRCEGRRSGPSWTRCRKLSLRPLPPWRMFWPASPMQSVRFYLLRGACVAVQQECMKAGA